MTGNVRGNLVGAWIAGLLSLDGFTVQRLAWGVNLSRARDRVGVTFAIENLANTYYRDHFQFAPSRGRSFTVGLNTGAF